MNKSLNIIYSITEHAERKILINNIKTQRKSESINVHTETFDKTVCDT